MPEDIELQDVVKIFPVPKGEPVHALDHISLSVPYGGFVSLVGPSGCGKSTCLRMAAGLLRPTAGQVRVGGKAVEGPHTDLGMVFQSDVLLDWRTALGNVMLTAEGLRLDTATAKERALELLGSVGLDGFEYRYPYELSGGMRQRVAICRALVSEPARLLMDEPFGAVDAITRDQLSLDLLRMWDRSRCTVLFVTHSIPEAVFLSDVVVVMTPRPGRIEEIVPIDLPRPRNLATRELPDFGNYLRQCRNILLRQGVIREEPEHV